MECLLFGTMLGPCVDHVWTMFGLALHKDQLEVRFILIESSWSKANVCGYLLFGTMKGPCIDFVGTMSCLSLLLDQPEL